MRLGEFNSVFHPLRVWMTATAGRCRSIGRGLQALFYAQRGKILIAVGIGGWKCPAPCANFSLIIPR